MKYFILIITIVIGGLALADTAPKDKIFSYFYPTFYMRVIDQDGLPAKGVEINVTHGRNMWISSNLSLSKYVSDDNGFIPIKVDSREISLRLEKNQNYSILLPDILYKYYNEMLKHKPPMTGLQSRLGSVDFEKFSKKENPFIISAWRIDPQERNAVCENKHVERVKLNADGRLYGIKLTDSMKANRRKGIHDKRVIRRDALGRPVRLSYGSGFEAFDRRRATSSNIRTVKEGDFDRNIQISFKRDELWRDKKFYSRRDDFLKNKWRFDISMKSGGLVEIDPNDLYQKRPPKSGYIKNWHLDNTTFKRLINTYEGHSSIDQRSFFLKLKDDNYARLTIRFTPFDVHNDFDYSVAEITIDYSVNKDNTGYVRGLDPRTSNREKNCVNL